MKINYVVYKVNLNSKGKPIFKNGIKAESINDSIELDLDWNDCGDHAKIRATILEKHKGYRIHGYCNADMQDNGRTIQYLFEDKEE